MKKIFIVSMMICAASCAPLSKPKPVNLPSTGMDTTPPPKEDIVVTEHTQENVQKEPTSAEEPVIIPTGKILAKTEFDGVVKTSYVQLTITDQLDEKKSYQLIIGDEARHKNFPWQIQKVKPGYFFIELPISRYTIETIAIPVGASMAVEPMKIGFRVQPDKITYLGTLKVVGTKERIKLGGIPVIRPGFEYELAVIDQRQEALAELKNRFPNWMEPFDVQLFMVNQYTNVEMRKDNL